MSSNYIIVGGGTSASSFPFELFPDFITVGCNDSALSLKTDILVSADKNWVRHRQKEWESFSGEVVICIPETEDKRFKIRLARPRLSENPKYLHGHNTGYVALNEVYQRKPKNILLVGFDFYTKDGRAHWHSGYTWGGNHRSGLYATWSGYFETTLNQLNQAGIIVLNCNPKSKVDAFRKVEAHEARGCLRP